MLPKWPKNENILILFNLPKLSANRHFLLIFAAKETFPGEPVEILRLCLLKAAVCWSSTNDCSNITLKVISFVLESINFLDTSVDFTTFISPYMKILHLFMPETL